MTSPVDPAAHATHDPLLIAAHAAGDATGSELDRALALVAGCLACAALHHDLRAIAAALPTLPAPRRPRDFRLTPAQAASLHGSGWRRFLLPLAGPRFAFAGPLGSGLAALGIAGILLSGGFSFGGATGRSAAVPLAGGSEAVVASPAAAQAPAATEQQPADVNATASEPAPMGPVTAPLPIGTAGANVGTNSGAGYGTAVGPSPAASPIEDKNVAAGGGASMAGQPPASTRVAPAAPATAPASPASAPAERLTASGASPTSDGPQSVLLLVVAAGLFVTGAGMAGLRVLARRSA